MSASNLHLFTIGVYGKTENQFFAQLTAAEIDTFCDVRWRRGMRGSRYAFANSKRLQECLKSLEIRYLHFRDLAPSAATRRSQMLSDEAEGVQKSARMKLSETFAQAYKSERLQHLDSTEFVKRLAPGSHNVVLFCVEAEPAACHRSLLASKLSTDLNASVTHL